MNILSSEQGKKARALARKAIVYFIVMQVTVEGQLQKTPCITAVALSTRNFPNVPREGIDYREIRIQNYKFRLALNWSGPTKTMPQVKGDQSEGAGILAVSSWRPTSAASASMPEMDLEVMTLSRRDSWNLQHNCSQPWGEGGQGRV